MKAKPVKLIQGEGYVECPITEATHVTLWIPGPSGPLTLPVMLKGTREGTHCWSWNGCVVAPTLRPSIKTKGTDQQGKEFVCHTWVNDGQAHYLTDSTHEHAGKTLDLLEVL